MKTLIIAEKPSVAADLARSLGKIPKSGDHYENDEYVISSAVGHLVELEMPEDIDKKKYGFWRLEMLPIIPDKFGLKPIEASKERFCAPKEAPRPQRHRTRHQRLRRRARGRADLHLYLPAHRSAKIPFKRAWMQTMTTEGIQTAFKNLRESTQMAGLADAARCRSESDWLIGINGTRALTKRMFGSRAGNVASVGRVQTPTLAIIFARELEIRNFKPRAFWRVTAQFTVAKGTYEGVYQRANFKKTLTTSTTASTASGKKPSAEAVLAACADGTLAKVTEEKKAPAGRPAASTISPRLQREANGRFGLPARRTLQIAQALYERHKVITYPRTDSRALPEDYIPTCRETLKNLGGDLGKHAAHRLDPDGCARTSASSTTPRSPTTSRSSPPPPSPRTSMRWRPRSTT